MGNVKIKLNKKAVRELLKSAEIMAACEEEANKIAERAGEGYEVTTHIGKTRCNASVRANTKKSIADCYENNTLLNAMGKR